MTQFTEPWIDAFDLAGVLDTTYQGALTVLGNLVVFGMVDVAQTLRPRRFHLNAKGREAAEKWGRS